MELRTDDGRAANSRAGRFVIRAIPVLVLVAGVAGTPLFGPSPTPLLDTLS